MATTLVLTFPWGRYHATSWGRHVNEAEVEWPPSPYRVLRALYATWKQHAPELDKDVVHALLRKLATPPRYRLPPATLAHTRHFLPDSTHLKGMPRRGSTTAHSNDATGKTLDAFMAFGRGGEIGITWDAPLGGEHLAALRTLAERLPYLGRSESICVARVAGAGEQIEGELIEPVPEPGTPPVAERVRLLAPRPDEHRRWDPRTLAVTSAEVRAQKVTRPAGTVWVAYTRPAAADTTPAEAIARFERPTAVRWAVTSAARPSRWATVAMTHALRASCLSSYGALTGKGRSPTLSGKDPTGRPLHDHHRHAHYLAVADGRGLLQTFVLWAPGGLDSTELGALARLPELTHPPLVPDFRPCHLGLEAVGTVEQVAPELCGRHVPAQAATWTSHTPFAPPPTRHRKRKQTWEQFAEGELRRELRLRGFPEPVEVTHLHRQPWLRYRRHRPTAGARLAAAPRATGFEVRFPVEVRGPIALGGLCHFGLGLFVPAG